MILYGIVPAGVDVRRFSKFGISTLLDSPVDRGNALKFARSTCSRLLHELRRYVRILLIIEVSMEGPSGKYSGSTRKISGGGMSVHLARDVSLSGKLRLTFTLPDKPSVSIEGEVGWQKGALVGPKFEESVPARQVVRDWINSFLGLD